MTHAIATPWDAGSQLAGYAWKVDRPRAALLLQHGYAEYAERFVGDHSALIPRLRDAGISVFAFDMEGHGRSPGKRGVVDVEEATRQHIVARLMLGVTGLPLFLLGHSLGGLVTAASVTASPERVAGVILSSPAFDRRDSATRLMVDQLARVNPELDVAQQQDPAGLARNDGAVTRFARDPLVYHGPLPALMVATALRMADRVYKGALAWTTPTLIVHGTADPFTSSVDSAAFFDRLVARDKTLDLVADGRHELLNDAGAEQVLAKLLAWIDDRIPASLTKEYRI